MKLFGVRTKLIFTLSFLFQIYSQGAVLQLDKISWTGEGCNKDLATLENVQGEEVLVIRWNSMKTSINNNVKRKSVECGFIFPIKAGDHSLLRFSNPTILGAANLAPWVAGVTAFEMSWGDHPGPNFELGYRKTSHRIQENFGGTAEGTEIVFECNIECQFRGRVLVNQSSGWGYAGGESTLQLNETRIILKDLGL